MARQIDKDVISNYLEIMRAAVHRYEEKYQGKFAEPPHVGLGNRKTRCVNEATLPIITCHPSCLEKCASSCYVLSICTIPRPNCRNCEAKNTVLRRIDPDAYYEHFFKEALRLNLPVRLSDGGDFENEPQVLVCIKAALKYTSVQAILYTKRIELLPLLVNRPANLHARYSSWKGDEEGERYARSLGFEIAHVVYDGSGNCPYQNSLARFLFEKQRISKEMIASGMGRKEAGKKADRQAGLNVRIWHCKDCAEYGCGCCGSGDISFNIVG